MHKKAIALTFCLATGILFPFCDFYNPCKCPANDGDYFDIKGVATDQINAGTRMTANQTATFDSYALYLNYAVDYVVQQCEKPFSLTQSAWACDCAYNGYLGAKNEHLASLQVITLNDFDAEHLANDTLNELITASELGAMVSLEQYLVQDTSLISQESLILGLTKAPSLNDTLKLKIKLTLSNNEQYEVETFPVIIR
jgi:hypothetical protein